MFLERQLEYLLWLQDIRTSTQDLFTPFFLLITSFGEYLLPILTCSIIYWCIDKKLGALMILSSSGTLIINHLLKNIFCIYRPWMLDPHIKPVEAALHYAGGYSFPSGHSSLAVTSWGAIGLWYKKHKITTIVSVLLCLAVAFSRNYLGVHTLQDILIGLLTSLIVLITLYKLLDWCEKEEKRNLILALTITLMSILIAVYTYLKDYPLDYDTAGKILISPDKSKLEVFPKVGLILGAFWGWYIENRFVKFDARLGCLKTKIFRGFFGLILLILIMKTLPLWKQYCGIPHGGFWFMAINGLFITLIYPWIMTKIPLLNNKKTLPAPKQIVP